MYRLLSLRYSYLCKTQFFTLQPSSESRFLKCAYCKTIFNSIPRPCLPYSQVMFYSMESSRSAALPTPPRKRKRLRKFAKKYTELLEVSDSVGSSQTKAKVSKLKARQLSLLMDDPVVHDIRVTSAEASELLNAMSQSAEAKLVQEDQELELLEEFPPEIEEIAEPVPKTSKKTQLSKQQAFQAMYQKLEMEGKAESLARSLTAYLDLCVSCGFVHRGYSTLLAYRGRSKKNQMKSPPINSISPYNVLLSCFAGQGNLGRVSEVMDIVIADKITPNVSTFVSCFECVGRQLGSPTAVSKLKSWTELLKKQGLSLNSLFLYGIFHGDRYDVVLQACRKIENNFNPDLKSTTQTYTCNLLKEISHSTVQGRTMIPPGHGLLTPKELQLLAAEQLNLEIAGSVTVKSVEKNSQAPKTTAFYRERLDTAQTKWREVVTDSFHRNLQTLKIQHQSHRGLKEMTLYPFLKVLPEDQYIDIIMQEIRKLAEGSETFSPTLQLLYRDIGIRVLTRYQVQSKVQNSEVQKTQDLYHDYCNWYTSDSSEFTNFRNKWQQLIENATHLTVWNSEKKSWPNHLLINLGKFLYAIILHDIKIDINMLRPGSKKSHVLPAFYSLYRSQGRFVKEEVKPHPILSRLFRGAALEELSFDTEKVPMLSPPIPWTSVKHGGHIIVNTDIIRLPTQAAQQWERLIDAPPEQLYPVLDALNQLGSVPWKISEHMLDIVIKVFNSGGSADLDIPEPPSACPSPDQITSSMTKNERFQVYRKRLALRRKKAEMYSLWCDTLYRLSLANHYRKHIFWLPHNMDFRGRVYPCPPHLNHMGSDMPRALLCFAKGEPLGKDGLNWLKIHIVNLTGLKKKESITDRLQYAEKMMPEILDSADNPLTGRRWWMKSEEPWQTLACCKEVANASRSADHEKYICHFPIHQDGSCNGLQHYAALGRDEAGAFSVNLAPATVPQDVYSCVAVLVERERVKDANAGLKIAQILDGFVRRKVIKQTVMTTVYGVTRFGARLQIARQLKDIDSFPNDFVWQASTYLVGKTFESLREMFTSTKEIQDWFTESARLISQVAGQNVEWVTPIGLPIVQPYSRFRKVDGIQTTRRLQECFSMDMFERPNVMKQKNAFPPNFIHSLDSSHMMLTSLFCEHEGITFVSVHDCYWTHPSTVGIMNKICREQFVALHQQPILEDLSKSLVERYSFHDLESEKRPSVTAAKIKLNHILTQVPPRGSFDLSQVLESVYFFS